MFLLYFAIIKISPIKKRPRNRNFRRIPGAPFVRRPLPDYQAFVRGIVKEEVEGFNKFLERYKAAVPVEAKAVECVKGQHCK